MGFHTHRSVNIKLRLHLHIIEEIHMCVKWFKPKDGILEMTYQ